MWVSWPAGARDLPCPTYTLCWERTHVLLCLVTRNQRGEEGSLELVCLEENWAPNCHLEKKQLCSHQQWTFSPYMSPALIIQCLFLSGLIGLYIIIMDHHNSGNLSSVITSCSNPTSNYLTNKCYIYPIADCRIPSTASGDDLGTVYSWPFKGRMVCAHFQGLCWMVTDQWMCLTARPNSVCGSILNLPCSGIMYNSFYP